MTNKANESAFPIPNSAVETGLTKRECAAIAAMQGLLANNSLMGLSVEKVARDAVEQADALLAELEKGGK